MEIFKPFHFSAEGLYADKHIKIVIYKKEGGGFSMQFVKFFWFCDVKPSGMFCFYRMQF